MLPEGGTVFSVLDGIVRGRSAVGIPVSSFQQLACTQIMNTYDLLIIIIMPVGCVSIWHH
jgi:hypothetical protein